MRFSRYLLLAIFILMAVCTLGAADVKAKVGGKNLVFPQPEAATPPGDSETGLMQYFESDEMRGLAYFISPGDVDRIDMGMQTRDAFYFALSYKPLETLKLDASEFIDLIGSMGDAVEAAFAEGFDSGVQEASEGSTADMFMIGKNYSCDDYVSYTILMKFSFSGVTQLYVGNMALANVGGKMVYCYTMQTYDDYTTIGNVETKSRTWLDKVVAAN